MCVTVLLNMRNPRNQNSHLFSPLDTEVKIQWYVTSVVSSVASDLLLLIVQSLQMIYFCL